ncbi:MAG: amidohydrolase family protein [Gemmatimonadaceae bacterium]
MAMAIAHRTRASYSSFVLLALATVTATVTSPAPATAQVTAITGGKVYPVSGPPIENATVLLRNGKITAVGANVEIPTGATRVDASGKWVTPGLFNAATQLGLVEVGQVSDTRQATARGRGDGINAAFTAWVGLNPLSVLFAPARNEGVTTVIVAPGGGMISGQAAAIDLVDGSVTDMLRKAPVAMVGQISQPNAANLSSRGELVVRLRELIEDTRVYMRRRADYDRADTRPFVASRIDLEAMIPVVEGRLPLVLDSDKASDIEVALGLAKEYRLKLIIAGGAEAWMVAEKLAAAKVPVLTGALNNIPGSFSSLGQRQENAAILRRAGVEVVLIGNGNDPEAFNVRNIKQDAGNAVAYGLSWDEALRAVTLAPAQVFGVDAEVGALKPGMAANVVVWSGDPFEFTTRAEHVFVRGQLIESPSRQDLLVERYKKLPPSFQAKP